jgi:16S rRNA (guanine(966)-N(2))-methyltransferase RsmD
MRIIAGKYKGKRLAPVQGDIRPSSDRLRETLFNVLGDKVIGTVWVDAMAGTGAVGIEALSRGASRVVFNDRSPDSGRLLRKNLVICQVEEGAQILALDVFVLFRTFRGAPPDFVFLDPPYDFGRHDKLLRKLAASDMLGRQTVVILEAFKKMELDECPSPLEKVRVVDSGDSRLFFLKTASRQTP